MATEPRWLTAARRDLGVQEVDGPESHPRIAAMFAACGFSGTDDGDLAWCGIHCGTIMRECGIAPPAAFPRARAWAEWGTPLAMPVPGCIAVYTRTNNPQMAHVAQFLERKGDRDTILGANQSDGVTITTMPVTRLLAYRWPPGEPPPGTPVPKPPPAILVDDAKRSWTVTGGLTGLLGIAMTYADTAVQGATQWVAVMASDLGPLKSALLGLGSNAKSVGLAIAVAGIVIVIKRRLGEDSKVQP